MTGRKGDDLRPFLLFAAQPTRPLGAALPRLVTPEVTSPWTPRTASEPAQSVAVGPSAEELAHILDQARADGRDEGLAETAALRDQLAALLAQLTAARAAVVAPAAEVIAEVCGCVIESWLDREDRGAVLAPVVRGWLAASDQPATVRVHPDDVDAIGELIGDAPLTVVSDRTLARGAMVILGTALEATHDWRARLPELRTAIAAALSPDREDHTDGEARAEVA